MHSTLTFTIQIPSFLEVLDCKINDSPNKASRWPIGFNKMDIHLYVLA